MARIRHSERHGTHSQGKGSRVHESPAARHGLERRSQIGGCGGGGPVGGGHHVRLIVDGVALEQTRRQKIIRPGHHAKLVVVASEVAGRWSEEVASFVRQLTKTRARNERPMLVRRAEQARKLGGSKLECTATRTFAGSLFDRKLARNVDGEQSSVHDVIGEAGFAGQL